MHEVVEERTVPPGPGAVLRGAREARGLEVRDVARQLKLALTVIEALETDDFPALPAPIFIKGYLMAYGRLLGLPADELITSYERAAGSVAPPPLVVSRGTGDGMPTSARRSWWMHGLIVVVLAALVVLWVLARPQPAEAPASVPVITDPPADMVPPPRPVPQPEPQATEAPSAPGMNLVEELEPELISGNVRLRLEFAEECWTEITDRRGERLFFDLARAGRVVEVEGPGPLQIFLGNAPAVTIRTSGRTFDHSRYTRTSNVARFAIGEGPSGNRP